MTPRTSDVVLGVYKALGYVAQPLSAVFLRYRGAKGKEDTSRLDERYGRPSQNRLGGAYVWVHAASVGELRSILPLIRRITEMKLKVVVTTVTVTSARVAEIELPKGAVHQFLPMDLKPCVNRFLSHWRPSLAIFVESEIWPVCMSELSRHEIPQVLVNARMSARSFTRWQQVEAFSKSLFERINLCIAQTDDDAERFRTLGASRVKMFGNLKYDVDPPSADAAAMTALRDAIGPRAVWLAASTHEGEEGIIANAHEALKKYFPNLLTIVAPRHPERGEAIMETLRGKELTIARRSDGDLPTKQTDIYLADTLGELGILYRLAPCSLVGGSLIQHGGQNPIEPCRLGSAVLHGPNVDNFKQMYSTLDECKGSVMVRNTDDLVRCVATLLSDKEARVKMTRASNLAIKSFSGALERTHQALVPYLEPLVMAEKIAAVEAISRK